MTLQEFALFASEQLPPAMTLVKVYRAFEGDFRAIGQDSAGYQYRFTLVTSPEPHLEAMF